MIERSQIKQPGFSYKNSFCRGGLRKIQALLHFSRSRKTP